MNAALLATLLSLAPTHAPASHDGRPSPPTPATARASAGQDDARHGGRGSNGHEGWEVTCPRDVDAAFATLDAALYALADDVDDLKGRDRRRLRDDVAALVDAAEDARTRACAAARSPVIVVPPAPPPPPPRALVLDDVAHKQLVAAMKRESFDDGKLRIVDTALRGDMCVTAPQARDVMKTLSFSGNRLDVLRKVAPRLVDDGQAIVIYQALDFESDKDDARTVLSTTKTLPACRLPVPWR